MRRSSRGLSLDGCVSSPSLPCDRSTRTLDTATRRERRGVREARRKDTATLRNRSTNLWQRVLSGRCEGVDREMIGDGIGNHPSHQIRHREVFPSLGLLRPRSGVFRRQRNASITAPGFGGFVPARALPTGVSLGVAIAVEPRLQRASGGPIFAQHLRCDLCRNAA